VEVKVAWIGSNVVGKGVGLLPEAGEREAPIGKGRAGNFKKKNLQTFEAQGGWGGLEVLEERRKRRITGEKKHHIWSLGGSLNRGGEKGAVAFPLKLWGGKGKGRTTEHKKKEGRGPIEGKSNCTRCKDLRRNSTIGWWCVGRGGGRAKYQREQRGHYLSRKKVGGVELPLFLLKILISFPSFATAEQRERKAIWGQVYNNLLR